MRRDEDVLGMEAWRFELSSEGHNWLEDVCIAPNGFILTTCSASIIMFSSLYSISLLCFVIDKFLCFLLCSPYFLAAANRIWKDHNKRQCIMNFCWTKSDQADPNKPMTSYSYFETQLWMTLQSGTWHQHGEAASTGLHAVAFNKVRRWQDFKRGQRETLTSLYCPAE